VMIGVLNLFGNQILCATCAAVQFGRLDARYCSYSHIRTVFRFTHCLDRMEVSLHIESTRTSCFINPPV